MSDGVKTNGNQHSWGSIIFKVGDARWYGFTNATYGDKRERVKSYGMGKHHAPRGRSKGKYSVEPVKITGWKSSVQQLRKELAALSADGKSYGDVEIKVVVQYIEAGDDPITVELERCVWVENATSDEESPDPLKEEFTLDCMFIRRNGLTLFDGSEGVL